VYFAGRINRANDTDHPIVSQSMSPALLLASPIPSGAEIEPTLFAYVTESPLAGQRHRLTCQ
jgi:hypothetical protein